MKGRKGLILMKRLWSDDCGFLLKDFQDGFSGLLRDRLVTIFTA